MLNWTFLPQCLKLALHILHWKYLEHFWHVPNFALFTQFLKLWRIGRKNTTFRVTDNLAVLPERQKFSGHNILIIFILKKKSSCIEIQCFQDVYLLSYALKAYIDITSLTNSAKTIYRSSLLWRYCKIAEISHILVSSNIPTIFCLKKDELSVHL